MSKLDIILFGATGFTGQFVLESMAKIGNEKKVTWGVAARNNEKLTDVLEKVSNKAGIDVTKIPKLIADTEDEKSLLQMTRRASVIINCCGPYIFYGEPVIKACLATGTHHVDFSGEPLFMEKIQLIHHKEAEEKGVYIISACGFDSLVTEMGILHMMDSFEGELNSIERYKQIQHMGTSPRGAEINSGTWKSFLNIVLHQSELKPLRQKLYPKIFHISPELKSRSIIHFSPVVKKWCLPNSNDLEVALRTQRHFYEREKRRPVQVRTYVAFESFFTTLIAVIIKYIVQLMVKTSFTRNLLLNYPKFFSFGLFSDEGPSDETRKNTLFHMIFYGQGWSAKKVGVHNDSTNKVRVTKMSGVDPAYSFTGSAVVLSAVTIFKESEKMPGKGGVYPPGAAFAKTSLFTELQNHGLKVEIISETEKLYF